MPSLFKLGSMTMRSLLSKPATTSYPASPWPYYPDARGSVRIDIEKCIYCGACSRSCPADALAVQKASYTWSIDRFRCVQCDNCVRTCPRGCLSMDPNYTRCATETHVDAYTLPPDEIERREEEKRAKAAARAKAREEAGKGPKTPA